MPPETSQAYLIGLLNFYELRVQRVFSCFYRGFHIRVKIGISQGLMQIKVF